MRYDFITLHNALTLKKKIKKLEIICLLKGGLFEAIDMNKNLKIYIDYFVSYAQYKFVWGND